MNADTVIEAELDWLRLRCPTLTGSLFAGLDGLLVATDLPSVDAHHLAALAAATLGLGQRCTEVLRHGPLREYVVQSWAGCVVVYPAGRNALLTVVADPDTDLASLHGEARMVAGRAGRLYDTHWRPSTDASAPLTSTALATRTPMAALPPQRGTHRTGRRPLI